MRRITTSYDRLFIAGAAGDAHEQTGGEFTAYGGQFKQMVTDRACPWESAVAIQMITSFDWHRAGISPVFYRGD